MGRRATTKLQHLSREPETAYSFVISLANRKNIGYLLEVAAGISAIAGLSNPIVDRLAKACHYQISRIVLDAILRSNASIESTVCLPPGDIRKLVNNAIDATYDPDALNRVQEVNGTESAMLEVVRFLGQLGQVQISPFEEDPALLAGRTIGLFEVLPDRHRDVISQRVSDATQALGVSVDDLLGISVCDAAEVYLSLLNLYAHYWQIFDACLPKGEQRLEEALVHLDQRARESAWSFTPDLLGRLLGMAESKIRAFLTVFSRTPDQLRGMLADPDSPFQIGHPSCRMLPVDRYPIVALPGERYIIPNITAFRKSFLNVIDFSLLEGYKAIGLDSAYNQIRGIVLELYISDLLRDRLPYCLLIPETGYRTPYGESKSPDLCILDLTDASLIVVEAKARRLSPSAAATAANSDLDGNHAASVGALAKLPKKIDDLYSAPEFEPWIGDLNRISRDRAILVSVVSSTVFFHDEIEQIRAKLDSQHPLAGLTEPFCFLDLPVFERAVEVARKLSVSLAQILREHCEDARSVDVGKRAARLFRDRWMKLERRSGFAWEFLVSTRSVEQRLNLQS
jgi:hypothetical protein